MLARYDKNGNYLDTYKKGKWDENVPSNLRASFDASPYHSQNVTGYWTLNEPGRTGYYLELDPGNQSGNTSGNQGNTSSTQPTGIWIDGQNKISTSPPTSSGVY